MRTNLGAIRRGAFLRCCESCFVKGPTVQWYRDPKGMGRLINIIYNSVGYIDSSSSSFSPSSPSASSPCYRCIVYLLRMVVWGALGGRAIVVTGKGLRGVQSFVCEESPVGMGWFNGWLPLARVVSLTLPDLYDGIHVLMSMEWHPCFQICDD